MTAGLPTWSAARDMLGSVLAHVKIDNY